MTKKDSTVCLDAVCEAIQELMVEDANVQVGGFGTFAVNQRAARKGVNPATGEEIDIAAVKVASFRASKNMKEAINVKPKKAAKKKSKKA